MLFRANPTETFGDLCVQLEMNLHELTPLRNICQSGLGKIISVITAAQFTKVLSILASML